MSQEHAATLLDLTGDLIPSGAATALQLSELRGILLAALLGGETPADVGLRVFAGEPVNGAAAEIAALGDVPPPASPDRVARRGAAILAADQVTGGPPWTLAQTPTRTLGPFQDSGGALHWFDIYTPAPSFFILPQGAAGPLATLPPGTTRVGASSTLTLPAGNIWLDGPLIHASAPAASWAGLRISGGTATVSGQFQLVGGGVILRAQFGTGVTLHVTLDNQGLAGFPATVSIGISAGSIGIFNLAPGFLSAFGNTVNLNPATVLAVVSDYDPVLGSLLLPMTPDAGMFTVAPEADGGLFPMLGSAAIQSAAWAVPVTVAPTLADAQGPGSLVITIQEGLEVDLPGTVGGSIALNDSTIQVSPGRTSVFAAKAANPGATQTLNGWFEDGAAQQSSVELTREAAFPVWFFRLDSGPQAVVTRALVALQIDRPLRASGERLGSRLRALHLLEQDENGLRIALLLGRSQAGASGVLALALPNALLTVTEFVFLQMNAVLTAPDQMNSGAIHLAFPLLQLLPALPDPYAANFDPKAQLPLVEGIAVNATVIWTEPFDAHLDIAIAPTPFNLQSLGAVLPDFPALRPQDDDRPEDFNHLGRQRLDRGLALLDVSSNAGQLGMAIGFGDQPGGGFSIRDLTLNVAGSNAMVFLLPQFQCEPVTNKKNALVLGEGEGPLFFSDDRGPTLAAAETVRLVPLQPVAVMAEVVQSYMDDQHPAAVLFTLPFGIEAVAQLDLTDPFFRTPPRLEIVAPRFENFDGAPQLSLTAGIRLTDGQTWISGQTLQRETIVNGPPDNTLGAVVGPAFNTAFLAGIPIDRISLSGYGANIFSRWALEEMPDIGVTQVAFDAINGRTSFERVMITSYLLPCFARLVRTITLERYGNGAVVRWDSGWLATTSGRFDHSGYVFHPGPVLEVANIREISDTDYTVTLRDGSVMQAVYYDADIQLDGALRGAAANGFVPVRRHLGFVQQLTIPITPPLGPLRAQVISSTLMTELLQTQGRVGGLVDCQLRVGSSPHEMKVSGIFVENASNNEFAVAVYGAPSLHAAGQWSVVRTNNTTHATEAVDAATGIPLVRANTGGFRWADPADLLLSNPASDYGFLFSSKMQRILFSRPKIDDGAVKINSNLPPLLADPYSLLKAPGLFPAASQAIPFDRADWALESVAGVLQLTPTPFPVLVAKAGFDLLQAADWGAELVYKDAAGAATQFVIDSASDWAIKGSGVEQALTFPLVGEVMRVVHEIDAPAFGDGTFPNPKIFFDQALSAVADVLDMLGKMEGGLPAPLHVEPTFSGSTFHLSAVADFNIEDSDGNAIECGMGKLKGEVKLGADLSVEISKPSVNGSIFFEVTGSWQQLVFPFIYGGGLMRFSVTADLSSGTSLELDAAVTGSVGGDIIPFLISLEATVRYGYFLATNPIAPGFLIGIEGRAKLLSGLLGFKLSIDGRIAITRGDGAVTPDNICKLHGEILIAGTVTLAWLVDERKSFRTHFDVQVGWELALAAVKEYFLPVP